MRLIDADALMKELGITSDDCCECEWGDGHGYCTRTSDFTEACDAICTALPIEPEPQWIPCSERLPKEDKTVLITIAFDNSKYIEFGHIYERTWEYLAESGSDYWEEVNGVIAWMPLPEPFNPDDFSQHMNPPED